MIQRSLFVTGRLIERHEVLLADLFHSVAAFGELSRQSEVAELDLTVIVHEQVCWLDITMHNTQIVQEIQAQKRVVNDGLNVRFC